MNARPHRSSRKFGLREGDVIAISIAGIGFAFGRVCAGFDHAYYDFHAETIPPISDIIDKPIAFRVPVARDAALAGGWKVLGNAPLVGDLAKRGVYRHQPVGSVQAYRYSAGLSIPAPHSEVEGLEELATWFDMHVEQRLRDHFAGVPNATVATLRHAR